MKSLFVGLVALFASMSFAFAQDSAQDLNFSEYRKFLMSGEQQNSGKKFAIQTTCTTSTGQTYRIGETGYDTCLSSLKNTQNMKELSSKKEDSSGAGPSTGATIHFGN